MHPKARTEQLLLQEVGDELVVYDQQRHRAHRLNGAAALVWRHCDGRTGVADLAALLHGESNVPADEELVRLALDQLARAHLLQDDSTRPTDAARISRRQVLRKLGRTAAVALLVPTVMTILAPTPARAQSPGGDEGDASLACRLAGGVCTTSAQSCAFIGGTPSGRRGCPAEEPVCCILTAEA